MERKRCSRRRLSGAFRSPLVTLLVCTPHLFDIMSKHKLKGLLATFGVPHMCGVQMRQKEDELTFLEWRDLTPEYVRKRRKHPIVNLRRYRMGGWLYVVDLRFNIDVSGLEGSMAGVELGQRLVHLLSPGSTASLPVCQSLLGETVSAVVGARCQMRGSYGQMKPSASNIPRLFDLISKHKLTRDLPCPKTRAPGIMPR
jgi:hypothetical protein